MTTRSKRTITVLVGSGLSEGLGFPGTRQLSEIVLRSPSPPVAGDASDLPVSAIRAIHKALLSYYDNVNFELLLHAAEALHSSSRAGISTPDERKPVHMAFMDVAPRWREVFQDSEYPEIASAIVSAVIYGLRQYESSLDPERMATSRRIFESLESDDSLLRVFTLNYDLSAERLFSGFDGFTASAGASYARFDRRPFFERSDERVLCHLHGAINFGLAEENGSWEIVKYPDSTTNVTTNKTWWLSYTSQSRDIVGISPIISGLRKSEKTVFSPFGYYQSSFIRSLVTSPNVLLIGYGGRDTYIDAWLAELRNLHGDDLRFAVITLLPPEFLLSHHPVLGFLPFLEDQPDYESWHRNASEIAHRVLRGRRCLLVKSGFPLQTDSVLNAILEHFH